MGREGPRELAAIQAIHAASSPAPSWVPRSRPGLPKFFQNPHSGLHVQQWSDSGQLGHRPHQNQVYTRPGCRSGHAATYCAGQAPPAQSCVIEQDRPLFPKALSAARAQALRSSSCSMPFARSRPWTVQLRPPGSLHSLPLSQFLQPIFPPLMDAASNSSIAPCSSACHSGAVLLRSGLHVCRLSPCKPKVSDLNGCAWLAPPISACSFDFQCSSLVHLCQ